MSFVLFFHYFLLFSLNSTNELLWLSFFLFTFLFLPPRFSVDNFTKILGLFTHFKLLGFIEKLTPSPFLLFLRTSINLENRYNFFGLFGSFVDGLKKLKTFPYTKLNFSARCFNYSVIKTSFLLVVIESSHRNSEIVKNSLRGVFTATWVAIYLLGFIFALIDQ